eukprot:2605590-Prymnesium_polylepis.1
MAHALPTWQRAPHTLTCVPSGTCTSTSEGSPDSMRAPSTIARAANASCGSCPRSALRAISMTSLRRKDRNGHD